MEKVRYLPNGQWSIEVEGLSKSRKQYGQMLGNDPKKEEIMSWLKETGVNSNWGMWFIRNYKQDPEIFNQKNKAKLTHFSGMKHLNEVDKHRFDKKHDIESGFKALEEAEQKGVERVQENNRSVAPKGKKIIDLGDGWGWHDLGVGACRDEAQSMGHCGNEPSEKHGDRILSLRKERNENGKITHSPHLTFIENDGHLGEMKGRANEKPNEKYHHSIHKLLEHDRIKSVVGGGYEPGANFSLKDFKDNPKFADKYDSLIDSKPGLGLDHLSELSESHKEKAAGVLRTLDRSTLRLMTESEEADPDLLHALSTHKDIQIREHISWHHNTSSETLHDLSKDTESSVREQVARNFNTPTEVLSELGSGKNMAVKAAVATNSNTSPETLHTLSREGAHDDTSLGRFVASNRNTSAKTLWELAGSSEATTREVVAEHPNAPPELLQTLATDEAHDVVHAIASNKSTPPETLHALSESFGDVVVKNPSTSSETLHSLYNVDNKFMRADIARHPSTSPETLHELASDENSMVMLAVMENDNTSPKTLHEAYNKEIPKDKEYARNYRIAGNSSTPPDILNTLSTDSDRDVAMRISTNPSTSPETLHALSTHKSFVVKKYIGKNTNTSLKTLHGLHTNNDSIIRGAVAENPNSSPEILHNLHTDRVQTVRRGVATNSSSSPELLHTLHTDKSDEVKHGVAENPNSSPEILHNLHTDSEWIKNAVVRNQNTSSEVLHNLHTHNSSVVREGVAEHPNTSPETLHSLSGDTSTKVINKVNKHPNFKKVEKAISSLSQKLELLKKYRNQ